LTLPAHVSLMTGLDPPQHGVRDNGQVLRAGPTTLATVLRERGYATGAFVSAFPLLSMFGLDRGFDRYDDRLPAHGSDWRERPASATTTAALAWIETLPPGRPWLLWVHFYEPHDPYTPPTRFLRPGPRGAYDGEVAVVDEAVGELRRGVASRADRLLTVLTADHGESLGEHHEATHGFFAYDSTLQVPLLVHFPGRVAPGQSQASARLVDVAPTILDLVGAPPIPGLRGVSLVPTLLGRTAGLPPAYAESYGPWLGYGWAPLSSVRSDGWKLIAAPRAELYDLTRDPGETDNVFARRSDQVKRLQGLLRELQLSGATAATERGAEAEVQERLRALGYVGGSGTVEPPRRDGLADPKDKLATKERLTRAEAALARGAFARALRGFDGVLSEEPRSPFALLRSSRALLGLGRAPEAARRLERLLEGDPDHAEARYALADALTRSGDHQRAIDQWSVVTRLQPRRAAAWSNLGASQLLAGRAAEAVEALDEAAKLKPDDTLLGDNLAEACLRLAREELRAGRIARARGALDRAVRLRPQIEPRIRADPRLATLLRR
jgi:arylsulfatase A-like enzyme/Tfp pilus assembly protein PilF